MLCRELAAAKLQDGGGGLSLEELDQLTHQGGCGAGAGPGACACAFIPAHPRLALCLAAALDLPRHGWASCTPGRTVASDKAPCSSPQEAKSSAGGERVQAALSPSLSPALPSPVPSRPAPHAHSDPHAGRVLPAVRCDPPHHHRPRINYSHHARGADRIRICASTSTGSVDLRICGSLDPDPAFRPARLPKPFPRRSVVLSPPPCCAPLPARCWKGVPGLLLSLPIKQLPYSAI